MAKFKLTTKRKQGIVGISGILLGLYLMLILKSVRGLIPFILGIGILLWRFK